MLVLEASSSFLVASRWFVEVFKGVVFLLNKVVISYNRFLPLFFCSSVILSKFIYSLQTPGDLYLIIVYLSQLCFTYMYY